MWKPAGIGFAADLEGGLIVDVFIEWDPVVRGIAFNRRTISTNHHDEFEQQA